MVMYNIYLNKDGVKALETAPQTRPLYGIFYFVVILHLWLQCDFVYGRVVKKVGLELD